jgi:toxin ParE1/3/4
VTRIEFHPSAAQEAIEASKWYESLKIGLGSDFRREMGRVLERIAAYPKIYSEDEGVRSAPLSKFPYMLIYQELEDRIWIVAVAHNKRRPNYWQHRRKNS